MRVVKRGIERGRKVEFTCPHCMSHLRAREDELLSYSNPKKLIFNCPVCKTRRVIDRYKITYVPRISDYIRMALDNIVNEELVNPEMEEITYEY